MLNFPFQKISPLEYYLKISKIILIFKINWMNTTSQLPCKHSNTILYSCPSTIFFIFKLFNHLPKRNKTFAEIQYRIILKQRQRNEQTMTVSIYNLSNQLYVWFAYNKNSRQQPISHFESQKINGRYWQLTIIWHIEKFFFKHLQFNFFNILQIWTISANCWEITRHHQFANNKQIVKTIKLSITKLHNITPLFPQRINHLLPR